MTMLLRERIVAVPDGDGIDHGDDRYWQGQVDGRAEAAALVGPGLQVLRTTAAFDRIVAAGDGVALGGSAPAARLMTACPAGQVRLDAAIGRAATRIAPVAAALRCPRPSGRAALIVVIHPIPWATRLLHGGEGTAILTLIDPGQRLASTPGLWREAFALTPCEAALAVLLMAGHSLESAAAIRDCRPATLRVHLRRIFAKTATSRQSDLVALLARIG
jgi:DNA-binding CsgD family transcriptional regulator